MATKGKGSRKSKKRTKEDQNWAVFAHLASFAGFFFPFGNIIGPFLVWLFKKEQSALINTQAKEAINFQISMTIYIIIAGILSVILIGIPILIALLLTDLVLTIKAMMDVSNGRDYRYPMTIRFLK